MRRAQPTQKAQRGLAWAVACVALLLASFGGPTSAASAQTSATISTQDYALEDVNGTIDVVFFVEPGDDPLSGIQFTLAYDASLVAPLLFTDPNIGIVDAPACEALTPNTSASCGPLLPSGEVVVSAFRVTGRWVSSADFLSIPFVALGSQGQTSITMTELSVGSNVPVESEAISGSITIGSPQPAATATPTPTPTPTAPTTGGVAMAVSDTATLLAPEAVTINVATNDSFSSPIASITAGDASQGSVVVNSDLTLTYVPGISTSTSDSFDYTACSQSGCDDATVTITINPPECDGEKATIWGTSSADTIPGTSSSDVIVSFGGNDSVTGGAGDDVICVGDGLDVATGEDGDDRIFGGADKDVLRGGPGDDHLIGGFGNDRILGGIGEDFLDGGSGNDYLGGFGGNDVIEGGPGNEIIFGGFGADQINAGSGNDTVFGLIGNDVIDGGSGDDDLQGDRGNDTISGGTGNDIINGGNARDAIDGGAGDDDLRGGKADDTLSGGAGVDTCAGNKETVADVADSSCEITFGVP